jgi:hypothetical protein
MWQFKSWGFDLFNIKDLIKTYDQFPSHARYKTPINKYDLDGNFIERFDSVASASYTVNGSGAVLQRAAKLQNGYKAYGFQWRYDDAAEDTIPSANSKLQPNTSRVVQQYKDGVLIKEWSSGQDAAKQLGLLKSKISNCCNDKRKTHGGFVWKFK